MHYERAAPLGTGPPQRRVTYQMGALRAFLERLSHSRTGFHSAWTWKCRCLRRTSTYARIAVKRPSAMDCPRRPLLGPPLRLHSARTKVSRFPQRVQSVPFADTSEEHYKPVQVSIEAMRWLGVRQPTQSRGREVGVSPQQFTRRVQTTPHHNWRNQAIA